MEPTGVMDQNGARRNIPGSSSSGGALAAGEFTVCDLADEEVYFSRNSSEYYYFRPEASPRPHPSRPQGDAQTTTGSTKMSAASPSATRTGQPVAAANQYMYLPDSHQHPDNYPPYSGLPLANHDGADLDQHHEQVASNRLLANLGSRLRRGSNYVNAPARLIGQYLLGITIQNWCEFFNTSRMIRAPCTRQQVSRRLAANLNHFQGNYLCVSLVLVLYCILTSPLLLLAIAVYLMALYLVTARTALGKQTRVFGYRLNLQQQYSFITMVALPPLWIAGAPSAVFWVIGASFFVVALHAFMYASEQLRMTEQQQAVSSANATSPTGAIAQAQAAAATTRNGYSQILGAHQQEHPLRAGVAAKNYYSHYPEMRTTTAYQECATTRSFGSAQSALASAHTSSGATGGALSQAISQWRFFGTVGGGQWAAPRRDSSGVSASGARQSRDSAFQQQRSSSRAPEVKIISCDYAGLGRVYEV